MYEVGWKALITLACPVISSVLFFIAACIVMKMFYTNVL